MTSWLKQQKQFIKDYNKEGKQLRKQIRLDKKHSSSIKELQEYQNTKAKEYTNTDIKQVMGKRFNLGRMQKNYMMIRTPNQERMSQMLPQVSSRQVPSEMKPSLLSMPLKGVSKLLHSHMSSTPVLPPV